MVINKAPESMLQAQTLCHPPPVGFFLDMASSSRITPCDARSSPIVNGVAASPVSRSRSSRCRGWLQPRVPEALAELTLVVHLVFLKAAETGLTCAQVVPDGLRHDPYRHRSVPGLLGLALHPRMDGSSGNPALAVSMLACSFARSRASSSTSCGPLAKRQRCDEVGTLGPPHLQRSIAPLASICDGRHVELQCEKEVEPSLPEPPRVTQAALKRFQVSYSVLWTTAALQEEGDCKQTRSLGRKLWV